MGALGSASKETLTASDAEITKLEREGVKFWGTRDKRAHAGLRMIFDSVGLKPPKITDPSLQIPCGWCGGAVEKDIIFCYTCGRA